MTSPAPRPRDSKERTPPPTKANRNMGSLMGMLMVMVITSSVVVYGIMKGKSQQKGKSDTTQAETDPQPVDPFADITYAYGSQKGKPRATSSGSGYDSSSSDWSKARDLQAQAQKLIDESSQLRADGDFAWREKSAEAQELIEEAYELGVAWREQVILEKGASSTEAKSLDKKLQDWNRTRMQLHKTVGGR